MFVYILVILAILVAGLFYSFGEKSTAQKRIYCTFCALMLFLPIALKDYNAVGSDLLTLYRPNFEAVRAMDVFEIIENYGDSDVGFYLFSKLISVFTSDFSIYLAICAIPLIATITFLIYKKSKNPTLAFIMFSMLHYYGWSFIVVRHSIALAAIIMAFYFLWEGKMWRYAIFQILAVCFHKTAIIFVLALLVRKVRYRKWFAVAGIVGSLLIFAFRLQLFDMLFAIISSGHFAFYEYRNTVSFGFGGPILVYFAMLFVCTILYWRKTDVIKKSKDAITTKLSTIAKRIQKFVSRTDTDYDFPMNALLVGCVVTSCMTILPEFIRIGMFFTFPVVVIVPNLLLKIKDQKLRIACYCAMVVLLIYYGAGIMGGLNLFDAF